jgi:hypothetical protein
MCIGMHSARASAQASPKEARPFHYSLFTIHYSPFKILNSHPAPMKVNEG